MDTLDKILKILKEKKLMQKDLTAYIGVSNQAVTNWKNGDNASYMKYLPQIAEFLGVSVDYLVGSSEVADADAELSELLEELRSRSEMRMLFNLTKNASKEDVQKAVQVVEALLKKE